MTELERRALLGDAEAQRECTEKGILLPCPFCGGRGEKDHILGKIYFESDKKPSNGYYTYCTGINCTTFGRYSKYYRTEKESILAWNTRPAPPIGRCGECENYDGMYCTAWPSRSENEGCIGNFKPREDNSNG